MNRPYFGILLAACSLAASSSALADGASLVFSAGESGFSLLLKADDDQQPATLDVAPEGTTADVDSIEPLDHVADPFVPDVYPSMQDAARGLAGRWAKQASGPGGRKPAVVRVMADDPTLYAPVEQAVREGLRGSRVERCDGRLCKEHTDAPAGEAWLYVELPDRHGNLSLRATGVAASTLSSRFVDKAWVSNFSRYAAEHPGRWLVANSDPDRPAGTPSEAAQEARVNAARDLVPLVVARLGRCDEGEVHRIVERHLMGDRLVHDRFPQKYERPYGKLYREAVLVDASDHTLDRLTTDVRGSIHAERQSRAKGFAGAGAVLLVTYALYRFANAFTRGYFTWSLRTAAAVVAAGAVTLIVAVI
jgi:hypothetical protein